MNFFFTHHRIKIREDETVKHELVSIQYHGHNTNEGSEFLDDAIRMNDQPFLYMKENVATEYPMSFS